MFVNKNDLKDVTPMKNCSSDKQFLEFFFKSEIASDRPQVAAARAKWP